MRLVPIGVGIVNWNGREDTLLCLESLLVADPRPARVVVVDNASTDGSVPAISAWIARHAGAGFELMVSDSNLGFARASNLALDRLAPDTRLTHFFLLNNDATVDTRCFEEIELALGDAPRTGIMGVTIFEAGSSRRAWYAGGYLARVRVLGRHRHEVPQGTSRVRPTEFVSGCAMLISRAAWDALGGLPECYFMYFEDTEYCVRARAGGLEVGYAPQPVVYHSVASTLERGALAAALAEYRFARSRALFARRNLRGGARWRALGYLVIIGFARTVLRAMRGRPILAWAGLRGTVSGLLAIEGESDAAEGANPERPGQRVVADQ